MPTIKRLEFKSIGDDRGNLVALENSRNIPFDIKRVYYMTEMLKEHPRGFHAHKSLQQVAICVAGSCRLTLDDGQTRDEILLDRPSFGVVIEKMIWRELSDFSPGCVLLVLASELYDEADYIRNYDEFRRIALNA